jgi:Right handed beta helix region
VTRPLALACALSAAPSVAATICVDPAGPPCRATIQAGVDAAAAGDTVSVAAGLYFENVTVPPGKDGLRLVGSGKTATVVDPDVPNAGTGIRVESNRVLVTRMGVRNGQQYGVAVAAGVTGVRVEGLRLVGVRGPAAIFAEAGATDLRIVSNEIRAAGRVAGIALSDGNDRSLVRGNLVEQVDLGIAAGGERLDVSANRVAGANTAGIQVEGPRALVADNVVERVFTSGIAVTGSNPVVRGNRLENAGGFFVSCTSCSGGEVLRNHTARPNGSFLLDGGLGFDITADAPGLVVRENRASGAAAVAYRIQGTGVRVVRNVAHDTGSNPQIGYGFLVRGNGPHTLVQNLASDCGAAGFAIAGDEVTLDTNVSLNSGGSGFLLFDRIPTNQNERNRLRNNRAIGSNAAGFTVAPGSVDTTLVGNRGAGNRYDFCDDGLGTDANGNHFGTTSSTCDIVR